MAQAHPFSWRAFGIGLGCVSMFAGMAAQSIGYYLCVLVLSAWILRHTLDRSHLELRRLMYYLALTFAIFNVMSLVNFAAFPSERMGLSLGQTLRYTRLNNVVLGTALFLLILRSLRLPTRDPRSTHAVPVVDPNQEYVLDWLLGLGLVAWVAAAAAGHQAFFGWGPTGGTLGESEQVGSMFRARGFYAHPLSLSGVGLCLASFGSFVASRLLGRAFVDLPTHDQRRLAIAAVSMVGAGSLMIYFSAGRMAWLLLLGYALLPLLLVARPSYRLGAILGACLLGLVMLRSSDLALRISGLPEAISGEGPGGERFVIWKGYLDYWLERPWVGHGAAQIHGGSAGRIFAGLELPSFVGEATKIRAHNLYLETLASAGLLGSLVLLGLLRGSYVSLRAHFARSASWLRDLWHAWLYSVGANALHGLAQNTFFDGYIVTVYMAILMVLVLASARRSR